MALTKDDSSFNLYRLILQQAMGSGYKTQSIRQHQYYLRDILKLFAEAGQEDLIRQDATERNRYLFRPNESHRDSNHLFLLYSLSPSGDYRTDYLSAQIMQALEEEETLGGGYLRTNAILKQLQMRWSEKYGMEWSTKLKRGIDRLWERGVLQRDPNDARAYRLMPELPAGLLSGRNASQLQRLCSLIPMLSDRCMPESWGYRTKETLQAILEDRAQIAPSPEKSHRFIKADSRSQLILDDAILWDILSAHTLDRWIQVEYRFPSTGHIVRSCMLQPLKVWTNPGEGRSYLVARERSGRPRMESRPVTLPLDIIVQVYLLEERQGLLSPEERRCYLEHWFSDSFSGISAADCDFSGSRCAPVQVKVTVRRPDDMTQLKWVTHRPHALGQGSVQEDGSIVYSLQVTRPEDLEAVLIRYDDIICDVETEGHPFAGQWRKRRTLWHQVGIQSPYTPVEVILPSGQAELEPLWKGRPTPLLHPDMIPRIQNEIRSYNRTMCREHAVYQGDFKPYNDDAPVPTRLSWAELDWLERFLRDPLVGCMLDPDFRGELCKWLEHALDLATVSGYVRRACEDFLYVNRRIGRTADQGVPSAAQMTAIFDAMDAGHPLRISYTTSNARNQTCVGAPVRFEYYQGTGNLFLQLRSSKNDAMRKIRCTRIRSVAVSAGATEEAGADSRPSEMRSAQLLLTGDPEFRVRAVGMLQPYLDSLFEDPYGSMRANLKYPTREEYLLLRFLRLLAPGVLPTAQSPETLRREFGKMFPMVSCPLPQQYSPNGKSTCD